MGDRRAPVCMDHWIVQGVCAFGCIALCDAEDLNEAYPFIVPNKTVIGIAPVPGGRSVQGPHYQFVMTGRGVVLPQEAHAVHRSHHYFTCGPHDAALREVPAAQGSPVVRDGQMQMPAMPGERARQAADLEVPVDGDALRMSRVTGHGA